MDRRTASRRLIPVLGALLLTAGTAFADDDDKRLLSEAELDRVTAGAASVSKSDELLTFEAVKKTSSGRTVTADGSLELVESLEGITLGRLILNDNAQQNLQSLININAVDSSVNVLLNLNVNIDSEVGIVDQSNFNDVPRLLPARLPKAAAP